MFDDVTKCVHFVGFRGDDYTRAVRVFGRPDFVHRYWDHRAVADVAEGDTVVFGRDKDWQRFVHNRPVDHSFNDSAIF